ncbi:MAG: DnaJ domain-containing protein [Myxococcota bacterium]
MADRLDRLDYYALLGVSREDPPDRVRAAFHRFALKYHPDNHADPKKKRRANAVFRRGAEAYRVLGDAQARRLYDAGLAEGRLRLRTGALEEERRRVTTRRSVKQAKARPFFAKARRAMAAGDLDGARLNLKIALQHEPGNELLEELLSKVEAQRGGGDGGSQEGAGA